MLFVKHDKMNYAMSLADTQKNFMQCLIADRGNVDGFLSELSGMKTLTPDRQLSIYKSNLDGAHEKVLAQVYPACRNIVGEKYFNQLCRQYRYRFPSVQPDLNNYGKAFSGYLKTNLAHHKELEDFNYLPDLALLEWYWHATYFSEDDRPFDFNKLAQVSVEQQQALVFKLSHAFSVQKSAFPVIEIWHANNTATSSNQMFEMPESDVYYCVFRKDYQVDMEVLSQHQFDLLVSIGQQHTLNQLSDDDANIDLQQQLQYYIKQGWISGFYFMD